MRRSWRKRACAVSTATLVRGDACALPFGDQSFDLVVCLEILEHRPDPAPIRQPRPVAQTGCLLGVPHEPFLRLGNLRRGGNVTRLGDPTDHRQPRRSREFAAFGERELAEGIRAAGDLSWLTVCGTV